MVQLDPGIYTNIFPLHIEPQEVVVQIAPLEAKEELRYLKEEAESGLYFYTSRKKFFAYGPDVLKLSHPLFKPNTLALSEVPKFTKHCILQGLRAYLLSQGYWERRKKVHVRLRVYPAEPTQIVDNAVYLYRGYDISVFFWNAQKKYQFGLVVDIHWAFQDSQGNWLNISSIRGHQLYHKVVTAIGEYILQGRRYLINSEIARTRFVQHILPFVQSISSFPLPCGALAHIRQTPVRVILTQPEG